MDEPIKIRLRGAEQALPGLHRTGGAFDAQLVIRSPDGRYAVAQILGGESFVAFEVESQEDGRLAGRFVDAYLDLDVVPMLKSYRVDWSHIDWGFAKLILFAPEQSERFKGAFEGTVHRFWFDRPLYERRYLEKFGIPSRRARQAQTEQG